MRVRNVSIRHGIVGLALLLLISACSALTPENPAATLQAQRQGFVDEATSIAQAAQVQSTQVMGTAVAAQTYVAQIDGRNQQLLATMAIAYPPTQALVENAGPSTPGQMASPAPAGSVGDAMLAPTQSSGSSPSDNTNALGDMQFTQVGTAASVRDTDGCAVSLVYSFPADVQQIYITSRALNIKAGTEMRVEWYYEGQLNHSESFTVKQDDNDFCLWFSLEPTDNALSSGNWSVSLFANNQPTDPPSVDFTVGS
ncbi:MAG: hypothetical protein GC204_08320 [Chloroflexi bacterium]|nr:hypothetical protein [Chloroflexota bacterium]